MLLQGLFTRSPWHIVALPKPKLLPMQGGGGMNPFDMGKMMESVKKAQAIVQEESQKMQVELARCGQRQHADAVGSQQLP